MSRDSQNSQNLSVQDILKSIKGVIERHEGDHAENEEDLLELTDILDNKSNGNILGNFSQKTNNINNNTENSKDKIIEDLLMEILKPALKKWLDQNLTSLVHELIEKEIKRLVSK